MSQPTKIPLLIRSVVDVHFGANDKKAVANIGGKIEGKRTNNVVRQKMNNWLIHLLTLRRMS